MRLLAATVGVAMAATGWALFFPLIASSHPSSIAALPIWVVSAYLVGAVSTALVRAERECERIELQQQAAHALRAPLATIHGPSGCSGRRSSKATDAGQARLRRILTHYRA